ncbi:6279_t:CDS:2 [Diversispora eburnea]|uniref:GDT1 family protein n=1 Tax=Diversispora eburnea TaxID=1213867 RepID=A0A9N8UVS7_9GLOM|nr:6279_t:CDS:2 [Diversispora eburnea]
MHRRKILWVVAILIIIFGVLLIKAEEISDEIDSRNGEIDETVTEQLVNIEAEDPDLVGSVLDIDLTEVNKGQDMKSLFPVVNSEESGSFFIGIIMIIVSEIGDKTFFIAAIMAMKNSRLLVFTASFSALALMSILSAAFGHAVPNLISQRFTNYLASLLFIIFGIKMAIEGYNMTDEEASQELEEVSLELKEKEEAGILERVEEGVGVSEEDDTGDTGGSGSEAEGLNNKGMNSGTNSGNNEEIDRATFKEGLINLCQFIFSPIFVQTFVLNFLAEWGDRSQIATIAIAAAQDMLFAQVLP